MLPNPLLLLAILLSPNSIIPTLASPNVLPTLPNPQGRSIGHATIVHERVKRAVNPSDATMANVYKVMMEISTQNWENGTMSQAILEYTYPTFSVFTNTTLLPPSSVSSSIPQPMISIASITLANRIPPSSSANTTGWALTDGDAAGDPASLGMAVLLANASGSGSGDAQQYGVAAEEQLVWLMKSVPKASNGAISQRQDQVQLWADYMYMAPPFFAYYGFVTNNQTLLQYAYTQCQLYRAILQDPSTQLWHHILQGNVTHDPGSWATGNAWAADGMMRVLATIRQSQYSNDMTSQKTDLQQWVEEILWAASNRTGTGGLVHNYLNDSSAFLDTSASALLAHSAFRLATLNITTAHTPFGDQIHSTIFAKHINSTGYLTGAVDPLNFAVQGNSSPEGQSFVVMMQAAYREYIANNGTDSTSWGERRRGEATGTGMIAGLIVFGLVTCLL